jgi:Lhr-like helicase
MGVMSDELSREQLRALVAEAAKRSYMLKQSARIVANDPEMLHKTALVSQMLAQALVEFVEQHEIPAGCVLLALDCMTGELATNAYDEVEEKVIGQSVKGLIDSAEGPN